MPSPKWSHPAAKYLPCPPTCTAGYWSFCTDPKSERHSACNVKPLTPRHSKTICTNFNRSNIAPELGRLWFKSMADLGLSGIRQVDLSKPSFIHFRKKITFSSLQNGGQPWPTKQPWPAEAKSQVNWTILLASEPDQWRDSLSSASAAILLASEIAP